MEPERNIEKLLRAYAKKRREEAGAPLELDPATRRLLQSEATRRSTTPGNRGFIAGLFAMLSARPLLIGSAAAAVLVCAITLPLVLNRTRPEAKLAAVRTEELASANQLKEQPAAPPPARAPARENRTAKRDSNESQLLSAGKPGDAQVALETKAKSETKLETVTGQQQFDERYKVAQPGGAVGGAGFGGGGGAPAATPATPNIPVAEADRAETASRRAFSPATQPPTGTAGSNFQIAAAEASRARAQFEDAAAGEPVSTAPVAGRGGAGGRAVVSGNLARLSGTADKSNVGTAAPGAQRFVRSSFEFKSDTGPSNIVPVLANFTVEQNGGELRVVDRDGSVYTGFLQLATVAVNSPATAVPIDSLRQLDSDAAKDMLQKKTDETARTFFRVAGTNRSSQQSVVFSGYFFALTNNVTFASASGTNAPVSTTAVSAAAAVPVLDQPALRNSLIQGLVEINNGRPIPLQATSAPAMQR